MVRHFASRPGGGVNLQQQIGPDIGAFLRASLNDGSKEAFDFSDINQSLSAGVSLQGGSWNRSADTIGAAWVINGVSAAAQRYFAAGGLGLLVGDGALPRYVTERIAEVYYGAAAADWATVTVRVHAGF